MELRWKYIESKVYLLLLLVNTCSTSVGHFIPSQDHQSDTRVKLSPLVLIRWTIIKLGVIMIFPSDPTRSDRVRYWIHGPRVLFTRYTAIKRPGSTRVKRKYIPIDYVNRTKRYFKSNNSRNKDFNILWIENM